MKLFISMVFIVSMAVLIVFVTPLKETLHQALLSSSCDTPIPYILGTIDSRFNLTNATVEEDIQSATSMWGQAEGKQLFVEKPDAPLKVNLVYDQRQLLDSQIQQLQGQLGTKNTSIQQQLDTYYKQQADFKQQLMQLNNDIQSWNEKGGAPADVYSQLTQRQTDLQSEAQKLNAAAKELNLSSDEYNTQVGILNQEVDQFNTALSQKPEEGLYDPNTNTITIYFATNHAELVHTLAHEFGHAFGMEHVMDPKAIMYPYTTSSNTLTQDDAHELQFVCRKQYIFVLWRDSIRVWLHSEITSLESKSL